MEIRKLVLAIVLLLTFSGGFFTGNLFTKNFQEKEFLNTDDAAHSQKIRLQKQLPHWEQEKSKVLIGYVQDFRKPESIDHAKLTHVIFSFAHPTVDGGILLNGDTALDNLRTHVTLAQQHDTKVILAVGGWYHIQGGETYEYFKTAISNPALRSKLVNELAGFAEREKLDGIDIDFEHPRSMEDAQNLTAFTKELSDQLHPKGKELSIAVHSKIHSVTGTEAHFIKYDTSMFKYIDHVNIMAYDGQWDGGYNAANLSPYPFTEKIVTYWANLFEANHLAKDKLVLGVPFYAQPEDPDIKQISYATIINSDPANANRDSVRMNGTTYHYNGDVTMQKKTKLALDHGFGGMMLWELGHDSTGEYSLTSAIFKALNI